MDPKKEVFAHTLYQNACYTFSKGDEDISLLIKDISRFRNRDPKRSILVDPKSTNFIMTPDNGYPAVPYSAEYENVGDKNQKDEYLLAMCDEFDHMMTLDDVRPHLNE